MSRKTDTKIFLQMSGELEKLSTSVFLGYQKKFFSFLQEGKKLAYRNLNETQFKEENTFNTIDLTACQAEQEFSFTLEVVQKRIFLLRAQNQKQRANWIKAITRLKKQIIRRKFQKTPNKRPTKILTSTQHSNHHTPSTLNPQSVLSSRVNPLSVTQRTDRTDRSIKKSQMSIILQRTVQQEDFAKLNMKQIIQKVPEDYVKYNIFVGTYKTKVQNLFTSSFVEQTYVFFSSKSLYPEEKIIQTNLINNMLPSWAQVNKVYRINESLKKYLFDVVSIIQMKEGALNSSLQIRTQEAVYQLYCKTVQQRNRLRQTLQMAIKNTIEATINGKLTRKNYDQFVYLYKNNYQDFIQLTKQSIAKYIPNSHHFEPYIASIFIQSLLPFILDFINIVTHKKQKCFDVILNVLKQVHQQVKIHIKLTWDTSFSIMKGEDILKFLNSLAAYYSIIKDYITDTDYMLGMKELSKVYVRESWKNFESIILGIVEQEKRENVMPKQEDDQMDYIQTYAITDLFKFMYEVFDLASPCWQHKLHLHNVNKLMQRALSVYIAELKSAIDELVIKSRQLIAIANNYFRFCLTIDEFYQQKFGTLQTKTKESYEKIKVQYKELSGIIIDKIVAKVRTNIKQYFQKLTFYQIDSERLLQIIKQCALSNQIQNFHQIYQKRAYQKIFSIIRQEIIKTMEKQVPKNNKKKNSNTAIKKILEHLDSLSYDLVQVTKILCKGKIKIQKQLKQLYPLLTSNSFEEIQTLIGSSQNETKQTFLNLLNLREDYYVGSALHTQINKIFLNRSQRDSLRGSGVRRDSIKLGVIQLPPQMNRDMRASFSNNYMHEFDSRSSASSYQEQIYQDDGNKLISQDYIQKCKVNKRQWQREYLRLKNGALYLYENQKSQRSQNTIKIQEIKSLKTIKQKQHKPNFLITYETLNRQKVLQFRCESLQLRDRWMESIGLQIKRIKNQEKIKKHKLKLKQKNKNQLIIDYQQLNNGKSFFSYSGST